MFKKGEKQGILQVQEASSGTNPSKSVKIIECPVPILNSTALTNSVGLCTFVDSVMHDEYLHGQESIRGGSLESELAKSPSPVPVDFPIKQHISSNQKKGTCGISHVFVNFAALLLLEISEALYL